MQHVNHCRHLRDNGHKVLQFLQAEEEQRKADDKLTPGITATAVRIEKGKRKRDERENEKSDIELETEQCNNPRR